MTPKALTFNAAPGLVLELLNARLPTSLPLLRRLQFSQLPEGTTSNARIVFVSDSADLRDDPPEAFTVAYLDFSLGPDTQSWMYSTLEDPSSTSAEAVYDDQLAVLINEIIRLKKEYGKPLVYPDSLLVGTLHSHVRQLLERSGRAKPRATGNYDKWLFRFENLPSAEEVLPEGMYWDKASLEDCQIVVSRSDLPRRAEVLVTFPSLTIKLADGTPISWAFLGADGSLVSLHCEEPYRRRGFAKALAAKLFKQGTMSYGSDGWCSADVAADNVGSRGMCRRLGGETRWATSWILLDLGDTVGC